MIKGYPCRQRHQSMTECSDHIQQIHGKYAHSNTSDSDNRKKVTMLLLSSRARQQVLGIWHVMTNQTVSLLTIH